MKGESSFHDVTDIHIEAQQYESFKVVRVTITDKDGDQHSLRLFTDTTISFNMESI